VGDVFLCDYGGAVFGAIHCGLPFLLLNSPHASESKSLGSQSLDLELRKFFPSVEYNISAGSLKDQIDSLISNFHNYRGRQKTIKNHLYAPTDGFSSKLTALILAELSRR
jgi:hypothetical protein